MSLHCHSFEDRRDVSQAMHYGLPIYVILERPDHGERKANGERGSMDKLPCFT